MKRFIKMVGTGPHSNRHLSRHEAREALGLILRGEATPAQAGAFLIAMRVQGESAEELAGFIDAIRDQATTIRPNVPHLLDIGSPYDGRLKTLLISPAASLVAAAAGAPQVLHGSGEMPPKRGLALAPVLEALGIPTHLPPPAVQESIERDGFGYMDARLFAPPLAALLPLRDQLGLRTGINTAEKLYDLANAPHHVVGLTHAPYVEPLAAAMQTMGWPRSLIVQGLEGTEDVTTARPTRLYEVTPGGVTEFRLRPREHGLQPADAEELACPPDPRRHAEALEAVLAGRDRGPRHDVVALNGGLRLWAVGAAPSLADGIAQAREALVSGAAGAKLAALRALAPA